MRCFGFSRSLVLVRQPGYLNRDTPGGDGFWILSLVDFGHQQLIVAAVELLTHDSESETAPSCAKREGSLPAYGSHQHGMTAVLRAIALTPGGTPSDAHAAN
jgi:hypothetical protein